MSYYYENRVRYSETDSDGKLNISSIVNYFQDTTTFHSESLCVGMNYLKAKNMAWVLNSWQIIIDESIDFGEKIKVATVPYDFKSIYGYRNFWIEHNDKIVVKANSIWVLLDIEKGMPVKISDEISSAYPIGDKLDMEYGERKIKISGEGIAKEQFRVKKYHIDTNGHVNNACYVQFAEEYLPENFKVRMLRAEYKKAAKYGNIVCPMVYLDEDKVTVSLNDEEGTIYSVVEFTK
jgi:acyl-ACP thioesterase